MYIIINIINNRLLDDESAGKAKGSWGWFLKDSSDVSTNIWFLHVAAVESRLRVHAGRYVPDSVPQVNTKPGQPCTLAFINCVKMVIEYFYIVH